MADAQFIKQAVDSLYEAGQKIAAANVVLAAEGFPEAQSIAAVLNRFEWLITDVEERAKAVSA